MECEGVVLVDAACERCGTGVQDQIDGVMLACPVCGLRTYIDQPVAQPRGSGDERSAAGGFRLKFGRYAGQTIGEVLRLENGLRYLAHLKATTKSQALIRAIEDICQAPP